MTLLNESTRPTRAHRAILLFAWSAWCFGFYSLMLLSFVLAPIRTAFAPGESQLAWLTGVAIGMTGVGGLLFGWLADRMGRRASILIAMITFAAGNVACALAPGVVALAAARALAGLGIGGTWGAGQALIGETFHADQRGRAGAIAQTGAPLGLGLAAVMGSFVAPILGWRMVFALSALPALSLLALRAVPESDIWRAHPRDRGIVGALLSPAVAPDFARCFVLSALNMSSYWFAVVWLPRYLQEQRGLTLSRSGWATLAFVAGSLAGYLSFARLADRLGRRIAFTLFSALMAAGLLMFMLCWPLIVARPWLVLVFLFVAGLGTGTWASYGPMFSEIFPTRVRGLALSVIINVTRGIQFLAPVVIAAVAPRYGMSGGIALAAGFAVLTGAWIWTLPETRGRRITAGS
jgi:MFS family permease